MTTAAPAVDLRRISAPAPRWVVAVTFPLALLGLGIATYLTIVHYTPAGRAFCTNGVFNCTAVLTSKWSSVLGVPVAVLGLCQYVVMAALCSPWAWRSTRREVHLARLVLAVVGMAVVLWLISAEFLLIHAVCEWCSGVHVVTFVLFVCIVRTVPTMVGWAER
jgi:uncharacterized membrane protein